MNTYDSIFIDDQTVAARTPEMITSEMSLAAFQKKLSPPDLFNTNDLILPDGVRSVFSKGALMVVVVEQPPKVVTVDWIRDDSPKSFAGASYSKRTLSIPYQLFFCVFGRQPEDGTWGLTRRNELYYSQRSLCEVLPSDVSPLDDKQFLCAPYLLNCSRYAVDQNETRLWDEDGEPLFDLPQKAISWLCTQNWNPERRRLNCIPDIPQRINKLLSGIIDYPFTSPFNLSSEKSAIAMSSQEVRSWYTQTVLSQGNKDARLSSIDAYEQASRENPAWVLESDVAWLRPGYSVRYTAERILRMFNPVSSRDIENSNDLSRIVFNSIQDPSYDYPDIMF